MRRITAMLALIALCALAQGQFTATSFGPHNSDGTFGDLTNGVILVDYAGPAFLIDQVVFTGTINDNGLASFASELQVWITDPAGNTAGWGPINDRTWTGTQTVTAQAVPELGFLLEGEPGLWTIQFSESFDEPGVDAYWTDVTVDFLAATPQATVAAITHPTTTWHRLMIDLEQAGSLSGEYLLSSLNSTAAVHAQQFKVDQAGDYTIRSTQDGWDGILYLHAADFDFDDPYPSNLAINDDNNAGIGFSQLTATLDPTTTYWLLTAGFGVEDAGAFTNTFYGPGAVTVAPQFCKGDADCDSDVDFDDITLFVAAIGDDGTAWTAAHEQFRGHPPLCYFDNTDLDGDGDCDFDDIDPFIIALPSSCFE
jgi:hypothetical protein